ncbi:MAG: hypothetical protein RLZZ399_1175 [Verrucomicrobiota bacterium]|jgi:hypothetical protein
MRISILCGGVVLCLGAINANAAETAYSALKVACAALGKDAQSRVVEVSGQAGRPQPLVWKITVEDTGARGGLTEVEVQKGRVVSQRRPVSRTTGARLNLSALQLDSDGVFSVANAEAIRAGASFDRLNYNLTAANQAGLPTWSVELFSGPSQRIGTLKIAADNALVLERSPELVLSDEEKRAARWSKPGEELRSVPDAFHRFGLFSKSTAYKLKNWANGYGWTDEKNPPAPSR